MINLTNMLLVGAGGFAGSITRYIVAVLIQQSESKTGFAITLKQSRIPIATMVVNLLGSLIIGYLASHLRKETMSNSLWLLLAIGFCGGFTTLSTLSYEALTLLQEGSYTTAFVYVAVTVIAGLLFCWVGLALGRFSIN